MDASTRTGRPLYPAFRWTGPEQALAGTRPVFLYLRLSRACGDGHDAIERQRLDLCRMLAAEGGWTVMGEYIDRDSASAYAARERSGWRGLNAGIASGRVQAVAFWKLDRTSRVAARCLEWVARCQRRGVRLLSHQDSQEELNSVSSAAKLSTGVKALLAEAETDTMSERQKAAKRQAAEAGFTNGGPRPFGWEPGPRVVDEAGRSGRRLEPHPVEYPALGAAVSLVLGGAGLRQVAVHWQAEFGITGTGGGLVSEQKVRAALISPRMLGYRIYHRSRARVGEQEEDPLAGIARTAEGRPVISQQPVCDYTTWEAVYEALRSRNPAGTRQGWGRRAWLLTGVLICPCGAGLHGIAQPQRPGADGQRRMRYVYRCRANRLYGTGTCTGGASITAPVAEQYVVEWLFGYFSAERLDQYYQDRRDTADTTVQRVEADLATAREELESLQSHGGGGGLRGGGRGGEMGAIVEGMVAETRRRIEALEAEYYVLMERRAEPLTHQQLRMRWPRLNNASRRRLLGEVIERIDLRPGRGSPAARMQIIPR